MTMITLNDNSFSEEQVHRAYLKCRKGKRSALNTAHFEANLYNEIISLSEALCTGTYKPSRAVCFYLKDPKLREVFAADFRDRVVHRLIVDILEPRYEPSFIYDSYACRREKGTHAAVRRLRDFIRKSSKNRNAPCYFLQLDIKGFFMEIDKSILGKILRKKIKDEALMRILRAIVFHDPSKDFMYKGKVPRPGILPPHKTLFHKDKRKGIPIGNLTSQFFANLYLNEMDQYIKRNLSVKYYLRYMDDFILIGNSPEELVEWREKIIKYLYDSLSLVLKEPNKQPVSVYKGIDFLGYFVKPGYTLIRRRVVRNYKRKLRVLLPGKSSDANGWRYVHYHKCVENWKKIQGSINSYLGHFYKGSSRNLIEALGETLRHYCSQIAIREGYVRLVPEKPDAFISLRAQVIYFQNIFKGSVMAVQVGCYYELYGMTNENNRKLLAGMCARRIKKWGNTIWKIRPEGIRQFIQNAMKHGVSGVIINQAEGEYKKIRIRLPVFAWKKIKTPLSSRRGAGGEVKRP